MTPGHGQDPYQRFGWLLWAPWLIFLAFPAIAALDAGSTPKIVGGLAGTATFAVIYVMSFIGFGGKGPLADRRAPVLLAALVVVVLATSPAIGLGVLSFMPFLQSFGVFALRRPLNWWWTAAVITITLVLPPALGQAPEWLFLAFIVTAVSFGTGAGRLMSDQGAAHGEVRDALTLTAERDRFARDVHDVLGHSLTVVSVKAELAERMVDRDPERARAELVDIQALTRQALAEVRATVGGLRTPVLDDEVAAAGVALRAAGIEADLPDPSRLDPQRRAVAAWVLREAVTNVVRHSGARHCVVTLEESRLVVSDDGCGLAHDPADNGEGNGLRGLRERVDVSGGRLVVRPGAAGGTELQVTW